MAEKSGGPTNLIRIFAEKSSITIKQIHELVASLSTYSPLPRVVWIEEANLLTPAAQNALLKSLEEPGEDTTFYLTCDRSLSLLPTIRSRSNLIHLATPKGNGTPHLPLIKLAMSETSGNRLNLVGELPSDRSEVITWFDELLEEIQSVLGKTSAFSGQQLLSGIAQNAFQTRARLMSNCSTNLTIQNFFLHLPKTRWKVGHRTRPKLQRRRVDGRVLAC